VIRLFPMLLLCACESGLARLWQGPAQADGGTAEVVAPVVALVGRIGIAAAASQPLLLEPSPGDRLRPSRVKPLGPGLWLVRVQRPLTGTQDLNALSQSLGQPFSHSELEKRLKAVERAQVGLSLDRQLRIVQDRTGEGRRGTVVTCGGDPVKSKLHLMACLALENGGQPEIGVDLGSTVQDAGAVPLDGSLPPDGGRSGRDAGPARGLDAGLGADSQ